MIDFLVTLRERNEPFYYYGLLCLMGAVLCLLLVRLAPLQVLGTSAWYKPFKFLLSTTIFVWSMGWFLHYLGPVRAVTWYTWVIIALFTIENLYVVVQAARGLTSHFNVSTPAYAAWWITMAIAAVGISVATAIIGFRFFSGSFPALPESYLWGIRAGLIVFIIFSMQGLTMGARLAHSVGGPDGSPGLPVVNWSKVYGDLRIAHFMGMHALQVLPFIGFYLLRTTRGILLVGILYAGITTAVFVQALMGKSIFSLFR